MRSAIARSLLGAGMAILASTPVGALGHAPCPDPARSEVAWASVQEGYPATGNQALRLTPGGRLYVAADVAGPGGSDIAVASFQAATGRLIWQARYDAPGGGDDRASALDVSPERDTVYVAGRTAGPATQLRVFALDSAGRLLWDTSYGPAHRWAHVMVAADPAGARVYAAGTVDGGRSGSDIATLALDASSGTLAWEARYHGFLRGDDQAWDLAVSPDGTRVFVAGESEGLHGTPLDSGVDYVTLAYDARSGLPLWAARYDSHSHAHDGFTSLAVSPDGASVYVTGETSGRGGDGFATVAYDAALGLPRWVARPPGPRPSVAGYAIAAAPDGRRVVVAAIGATEATLSDIEVYSFDAPTGTLGWVTAYDGPGHAVDLPYAIAVSADGGQVVAAGLSTNPAGDADFLALTLAASSGCITALSEYDHSGAWDEPGTRGALGLSHKPGGIYLAGSTMADGASTLATVAFGASG